MQSQLKVIGKIVFLILLALAYAWIGVVSIMASDSCGSNGHECAYLQYILDAGGVWLLISLIGTAIGLFSPSKRKIFWLFYPIVAIPLYFVMITIGTQI